MQETDRCDVSCIHQEQVQAVRAVMIADSAARNLAELFKTLGDPTRVKLLYALAQKELCVCDLAAVIGASESAVSHQLRLLRGQRLVKYRREGKILYYALDDHHVERLFAQGLDHIRE
ncbi:MAG: ArsR/SmtB family transcription factor [Solirubrobacterales bacterium]